MLASQLVSQVSQSTTVVQDEVPQQLFDCQELLYKHVCTPEDEAYSSHFGDPLTFHLLPPAGTHFWFLVECLNGLLYNLFQKFMPLCLFTFHLQPHQVQT